jgi:NADPH2:quinone reductase
MKAIRFDHPGGTEVLKFEDIQLAPPGAGMVHVRHTAIGVNFIDTYHRSGLYKMPLPSGLGSEAAGVVEALGEGVTMLKTGDRVAYAGTIGAYAQANNVPADKLVKLPPSVSDEDAAAAMLKGMTAQYLLKRTYPVQAGQTILWHAAAGGVGLIAGQWAKHLGVTVIGTVGAEEKIPLAKANGCTHVISTHDPDWAKKVRALTNGEGVPVAYDSVGKATFTGSIDSLAIRGMLVSFGNSSGPVPAFEPALLAAKGSLYITRPTLVHYTRNAKELQETADDLFTVIASGAVKIQINQRFALADAAKAHQALESRGTTGATILLP